MNAKLRIMNPKLYKFPNTGPFHMDRATEDGRFEIQQTLCANHIGLFNFLSIQGCGRQIPWGCARSVFQRSQILKLPFLGGQDKFSRGMMMVRASWVKFSRGVIPRKLVS